MAISDTLEQAKNFLGEVKKKHRYKKSNQTRSEAAELQATLAQCRGKLESCKKDLNRTINTQSKNISKGLSIGADTLVQEQIVWDAAIGYMLVCDAIFALETINSYDAVAHAYDMLDAAMKQISGKKKSFPGGLKIGPAKERNVYGYITSSEALKEKEALLDGFFDSLKRNGDIDKHLAEARNPAAVQAERRFLVTSSELEEAEEVVLSDLDLRKARLDNLQDAREDDEKQKQDLNSLMDIHPPKDAL